jgi:signal transduction histidine kinase
VHLDPRDVDVAAFLQGIVGPHADVTVDVATGLCARFDALVLERVIVNLVANARAYGRPPISLTADATDARLTIVVEDAGEGVPLELVPRLFGRFVRGTEGHGSGLGLAIARAYARAHGGELRYARAKSGARFEVIVPQA